MTLEKLENIAIALGGLATVALSGPLSVSFTWVIMGLGGQLLMPVACAQTKPAVELQAAITKEQVDGDLKTAIAAYRKIAEDKSAPRDVRAKALLHLAGCYEKLGQQAQSVYQQIVRDFGDQPAALQAQARLAALKQAEHPAAPATMTQRKIETLGPQMAPGDTDGRRGVYWNDETGELIYGDLAGKSRRVIFKAKLRPGFWPSRDFSLVGVELTNPGQPATLAVVNSDGTGYREIARLPVPSECGNWSSIGPLTDHYLAIGSERTGKGALHLLPIREGKSDGAPVFIKFGDFEYGSTTTAGGLIYNSVKPGGLWAVLIASLDPSGRPGGWKRLDLPLGNTTNPWPKWSSDSNQIVYIAQNQDTGQSGGEAVHLHNLTNGEDREIYHPQGHAHCAWAVQQSKVFCVDNGTEKTEILSITVDSGEVERLHTLTGSRLAIVHPSRDDRALYLARMNEQGREEMLVRWEIATHRETTLPLSPAAFGWVSPDERWQLEFDGQKFAIRATSGGDWKALVSVRYFTAHVNFTTDGRWLLYHDVDAAGRHGLFRVATAGGQPERLGDFPTNSWDGTLEISPDESKIMVSAGDFATPYELWSLENFVPPAPKP